MTRDQLCRCRWHDAGDAPLIAHPLLSPVIADPAVVPPEESSEGTWHLYAHSLWGIHEYRSADGIAWRGRGIIIRDAMRPWIFREGNEWCLLYEKVRPLGLALSAVAGTRWRSWIEMRLSRDLVRWQNPRILLEPSLAWHRKEGLGEAVSCPCLLRAAGRYRLYYSASLVHVPDCGFNEPQCIGLAEADRLEGPYTPKPLPLLRPDPADPQLNLSRGSFRVLALQDGWAAFENGISWNAGVSSSAILLLYSHDGIRWERLARDPIVAPAAGWKRSHVYAGCPVTRATGEILLYYNARNDWPVSRGRESIGLAIGRPAEATA